MIKTRSLVQIRSHAQKYFQKLLQAKQAGLIGEGDYQLLMDGKRMATSGCHGPGSDGSIIGLGGTPPHGDGARKKKGSSSSSSKKAAAAGKAVAAGGTKNITSRLAHSYPSASSLSTAASYGSSASSSCVAPSAASLMVQVPPPPLHLQYSLYENAAAFYHQKQQQQQQQQHQDFSASFFPPAPAAAGSVHGSECDTGSHSDGDTSLESDLTDPASCYGSYLITQPHHQQPQQPQQQVPMPSLEEDLDPLEALDLLSADELEQFMTGMIPDDAGAKRLHVPAPHSIALVDGAVNNSQQQQQQQQRASSLPHTPQYATLQEGRQQEDGQEQAWQPLVFPSASSSSSTAAAAAAAVPAPADAVSSQAMEEFVQQQQYYYHQQQETYLEQQQARQPVWG